MFLTYNFYAYILKIQLYLFQGVQYPSVPRCTKPRRVDLYYSSWSIREGNKALNGRRAHLDKNHHVIKRSWNIMLGCVNCLKLYFLKFCRFLVKQQNPKRPLISNPKQPLISKSQTFSNQLIQFDHFCVWHIILLYCTSSTHNYIMTNGSCY